MRIIEKLEFYLNNDLIESEKFIELIDDLGKSLESQKILSQYVLTTSLTLEQKYKIFMIISELYSFRDEESYQIDFIFLYDWLLELMFNENSYEYSICYKFSNLLVKINGKRDIVFKDIISRMDFNEVVTIQIGICSMYGPNDFFSNINDGLNFMNIVFKSLENSSCKQIEKDLNRFVIPLLKQKEYSVIVEKIQNLLNK